MKKTLVIMALLFFTSLRLQAQVFKLIKTDFNTETIAGIGCNEFYRQFQLNIDTFYISNQLQKKKILQLLKTAKPYRRENYSGPDTRARVFIYYASGKVDSLCIGGGRDFLFNNRPMLLSNFELIKMLDTFKNRKHENIRLLGKAEVREMRKKDSMRYFSDSVVFTHHCEFAELAFKNIVGFFETDFSRTKNISVYMLYNYFFGCKIDWRYKINFIEMPEDNEEIYAHRPFYYVTFLGRDDNFNDRYSMVIYDDNNKGVKILFKLDNGKWFFDSYKKM